MAMEEEEEAPRLSAQALAALQEFLSEQNHHDEEEGLLSEDWRLSQFWYDAHTSSTIAKELHYLTSLQTPPSSIACIACPSLYLQLKKSFPSLRACLFEYDRRFQRYGGDFVFFDYNYPHHLASQFHHAFQIVVADPPYLSEECLQKTVQSMKLLALEEDAYYMLLTGAVQSDRALELLGAHPCGFQPAHENKLGNEFRFSLDRGAWLVGSHGTSRKCWQELSAIARRTVLYQIGMLASRR